MAARKGRCGQHSQAGPERPGQRLQVRLENFFVELVPVRDSLEAALASQNANAVNRSEAASTDTERSSRPPLRSFHPGNQPLGREI